MDQNAIEWSGIDAVLFDLDGVVTPTAEVHQRAWATMFNKFLADYDPLQPTFTEADYLDHVDGKPRYDGVRDFLASRGINIESGNATDAATEHTVCGLGNAKNDVFVSELEHGVQPFPKTVTFMNFLDSQRIRSAIVSSSRNAPVVLNAARLADRFELVVDGVVAQQQGLAGKPAPDTYCYAAERLNVHPDRTIVIEDALSGVASGRAGGFRHVVGVDRGAGRDELYASGATRVVRELDELLNGGTANGHNADTKAMP